MNGNGLPDYKAHGLQERVDSQYTEYGVICGNRAPP